MRIVRDSGSFRDPRGQVFVSENCVYRTVNKPGVTDYEFVRDSGLYNRLVEQGLLLALHEVDGAISIDERFTTPYVLEHPRLDFISYPYEWTFSALKSAALLQLEIYLIALNYDVTLTDASAYNVQFEGTSPLFIDHLAFRRYREGEYWLAHRQFCEQFLNPLLLRSCNGVPHNAWFRGSLEGISTPDLNAVLPLSKKLSWNVFTQVVLQSFFQTSTRSEKKAQSVLARKKGLSRNGYLGLLNSMKRWIEKLEVPAREQSVWADYEVNNSYTNEDFERKAAFVNRFIGEVQPNVLWDIGCNTGEYSRLALIAGAGKVIGFDLDQQALEIAFKRAREDQLQFLPLYMDGSNPSPSQGWAETERKGLSDRKPAHAILALAIVHHIAIAKNVPLANVVSWLTDLAPCGVIEFIPKADPMVQALLLLREDIFNDYSEEEFTRQLSERATILDSEVVSETGRRLFWYQR